MAERVNPVHLNIDFVHKVGQVGYANRETEQRRLKEKAGKTDIGVIKQKEEEEDDDADEEQKLRPRDEPASWRRDDSTSPTLWIIYLRAEGSDLVIYANDVASPSKWLVIARFKGQFHGIGADQNVNRAAPTSQPSALSYLVPFAQDAPIPPRNIEMLSGISAAEWLSSRAARSSSSTLAVPGVGTIINSQTSTPVSVGPILVTQKQDFTIAAPALVNTRTQYWRCTRTTAEDNPGGYSVGTTWVDWSGGVRTEYPASPGIQVWTPSPSTCTEHLEGVLDHEDAREDLSKVQYATREFSQAVIAQTQVPHDPSFTLTGGESVETQGGYWIQKLASPAITVTPTFTVGTTSDILPWGFIGERAVLRPRDLVIDWSDLYGGSAKQWVRVSIDEPSGVSHGIRDTYYKPNDEHTVVIKWNASGSKPAAKPLHGLCIESVFRPEGSTSGLGYGSSEFIPMDQWTQMGSWAFVCFDTTAQNSSPAKSLVRKILGGSSSGEGVLKKRIRVGKPNWDWASGEFTILGAALM